MIKNKEKKLRKQNTQIFMEEHGYYTETHEVITEDGYILTLSRLLKKSEIPIIPNRKPVALLVHGLMCMGDHWCMISPDVGLPYKLMNEGYDIWLPNLRGTPLSQKHVSLSTSSKSYWDFSFHELGVFDLSAFINYILEITGNTSLSYIGHSMGCSIGFVLLSTMPEYCSKIDVMIALAPAVYGSNIRNMGFKPVILFGNVVGASKFIRRREIANVPASKCMKYLTPKSSQERMGGWCLKIFGGCIGAFGNTGIEKNRLRTMSKEWPAPTSMKLFCHGLQCFHSNKARQYNYGRVGNMKVYGTPKPPEYDFNKVTVPVATFCSEGDELCRPADVSKLSQELPNLIGHYYVNDKDIAHVDLMLGKKAHIFVFKRVVQILVEIKNKKMEEELIVERI